MSKFLGWTPPPGVGVVPPPVHPETRVSVLYSDGAFAEWDLRAGDLNWSAVGDGPRVVAYAVVQEYKPAPEPREWWVLIRNGYLVASSPVRADFATPERGEEIIHVREVLPAAREVVAWAVVKGDDFGLHYSEAVAESLARERGGTVVKLSGVMPNE